jgi:hypothetical protein
VNLQTGKAEWKQLLQKPITNTYNTDVGNWICSCPHFFVSRFMLCKHLVQGKGTMDPPFFLHVQRCREYPFIFVQQQRESMAAVGNMEFSSKTVREEPEIDSEKESDEMQKFDHLVSITEKALAYLKREQNNGNTKWIQSVEKNFRSIEKMVSEIDSYENQRSMPLTTKSRSHNTRYLQ